MQKKNLSLGETNQGTDSNCFDGHKLPSDDGNENASSTNINFDDLTTAELIACVVVT